MSSGFAAIVLPPELGGYDDGGGLSMAQVAARRSPAGRRRRQRHAHPALTGPLIAAVVVIVVIGVAVAIRAAASTEHPSFPTPESAVVVTLSGMRDAVAMDDSALPTIDHVSSWSIVRTEPIDDDKAIVYALVDAANRQGSPQRLRWQFACQRAATGDWVVVDLALAP
jgi:hypothetical protein